MEITTAHIALARRAAELVAVRLRTNEHVADATSHVIETVWRCDREPLFGFFYIVAYRRTVDSLRRHRRRLPMSDEHGGSTAPVEWTADVAALHRAFETLSREQQLATLAQMTGDAGDVSAIARILEIPTSTMTRRAAAALLSLREQLGLGVRARRVTRSSHRRHAVDAVAEKLPAARGDSRYG